MKTHRSCIALAFATLAACAGQDPSSARVLVEPNPLGVKSVEVERTLAENGDRLLVVRGFDSANVNVASVSLRTGMVMYTPEPSMPAAASAGTELTVTVGEWSTQVVTPDRMPHSLGDVHIAGARPYLSLKAVAAELQREAGITVTPSRAEPEELAYGTAEQCPSWTLANGAYAYHCCYDEFATVYTDSSNQTLRWRDTNPYGMACRQSDGVTGGCTGTACTYGPCGFKGMQSATNGGQYIVIYSAGACSQYWMGSPPSGFEFDNVSGTGCGYCNCDNGDPVPC